MFDVNCQAEIKHLNVRMETHGDDYVPALDVKMMLLDVPVDRINSAIPGLADWAYEGDVVRVGEVNPFTVQHKLENLTVTIGERELKGCDLKKGMKVNIKPEKKADVEVTVQTHHKDIIPHILDYLKQEIGVKVHQRQLDLVENQ